MSTTDTKTKTERAKTAMGRNEIVKRAKMEGDPNPQVWKIPTGGYEVTWVPGKLYNDHVFICQNKKCKERGNLQLRNHFKSDMPCSACKQVMRYSGEQQKFDFNGAEEKRSIYEQPYRTTHAVFQVRNVKRTLMANKHDVVCHIEYIGLRGTLSEGAVIPLLTKTVMARYHTKNVKFAFWCDTSCSTGGSPVYYHLEGSKIIEETN